jgi:hypothetical protein
MLSSECITLLRYLLGSQNSTEHWSPTIKRILKKYVCEVPRLIKSLDTATAPKDISYRRILASLCVLGGYQESVRVGGRVLIKALAQGEPTREGSYPSHT